MFVSSMVGAVVVSVVVSSGLLSVDGLSLAAAAPSGEARDDHNAFMVVLVGSSTALGGSGRNSGGRELEVAGFHDKSQDLGYPHT
jgi:hypothetical protein